MKYHRLKLSVILLGTALLATATTANAADTLVVTGPNLDVFVDIDLCANSLTLCTGSGSVGAAADGNDSVVGIVVHVKAPSGVQQIADGSPFRQATVHDRDKPVVVIPFH